MKVQFGQTTVDVLSAGELDDVMAKHVKIMRDWIVEAGRGPKHVRWSATGTITATGGLRIGSHETGGGRTGPDPSMIWSVKRILVVGLTADGDSLTAYYDEAGPARTIAPGLTATPVRIGSDELVVRGSETMLFVGTNLATPAGTTVTVTGSAWELPATLEYRLL